LILPGNAKQFPEGAVTFFHKLLAFGADVSRIASGGTQQTDAAKLVNTHDICCKLGPEIAHKRIATLTDAASKVN
jgi:hypothetical protein